MVKESWQTSGLSDLRKQTNKQKQNKQKHVFSTIHMPIGRLYPTLSTNIDK